VVPLAVAAAGRPRRSQRGRSRRDAPVVVMQDAEHGRGDEQGGTLELRRCRVRNRRGAVESWVWTLGVVVVLDELREQAFEMALVQDDHVKAPLVHAAAAYFWGSV
jgi:hypothetical protein